MATIFVSHFQNVGVLSEFTADYLPQGWLPMDGVERAKGNYPELHSIVPASWKTPTHFTLPLIPESSQPSAMVARARVPFFTLIHNTEYLPTLTADNLSESFDEFGMVQELSTIWQIVAPCDGIYSAFVEMEFLDTSKDARHSLEIVRIVPGSPDPPEQLAHVSGRTPNVSVFNSTFNVYGVFQLLAGQGVTMRVRQMTATSASVGGFGHVAMSLITPAVMRTVAIYAGR